jgi:C4-dicarboxylate-specific signal transduction histidine kinase
LTSPRWRPAGSSWSSGRFHLPTALDNALTLVAERATRHGFTLTQTVAEAGGDIVARRAEGQADPAEPPLQCVKFTPEGAGSVLDRQAGRRRVTIAVSDTGVGIAPEDQAAIFEEFRQVGRDDERSRRARASG